MNGMSLHGLTVPVYQAALRYIVPGCTQIYCTRYQVYCTSVPGSTQCQCTRLTLHCTRLHTGTLYQAAYTQVHERH